MAAFAQCPRCLAEYRAPRDRRFHAEPNACPACGPALALADASRASGGGVDVVAETVARLLRGEIVAIKGLGGFHLACDARNAAAVARLRERKPREEKPFAVMVANAGSLAAWADAGPAERALLESAERPIVLLAKRAGADTRAGRRRAGPRVARRDAAVHAAALPAVPRSGGAPRRHAPGSTLPQPLALVMTSANPGGEPLVTGNDEALARLAGIADAFVAARSRHRRPLRRQRACAGFRAAPARASSSSAARAATRRAPSGSRRRGPACSRSAATSRTRSA